MRPPRPPITQRDAARAIALSQQGMEHSKIRDRLDMCESSLRRILREYKKHGTVRSSCQGQGKKDDVRWVFAGPRGAGNVAVLSRTKEFLSDDAVLQDVHVRYEPLEGQTPAYSTLTGQLRELNYTSKRVRAFPSVSPH